MVGTADYSEGMTIDIHPHVISKDEERYPRAPLGGKQSDWSRERPVGAEEMLAAMDETLNGDGDALGTR